MTGFSHTASLLTVIQSCRAQGRSVLEFLREAFASVDEDNFVSLIPTSDHFVNPFT
jgi:transposase